MNKIFILFLVLIISTLSVSCVCAAEVDNDTVTDSSTIDGSFDIDDSISQHLASDSSSGEVPLNELPRVDDKKLGESDVCNNANLNDSLVSNDTDLPDGDENINGSEIDIPGPKIKPNKNVTPNGPKLDIKGPKITVPLNISGPKGTLLSLQDEIDKTPSGGTLRLWMDYIATLSAYMVKINKDLTIDGRGKTIDCQSVQNSGVFLITNGNVILKNIKIVNSQNPYQGKGTVSVTGSAQCTLINCTFEKNWGNDNGNVIWNNVNNPLTIINCSFSNNSGGNSGIVWSAGVLNVINSTFDSNSAYVKGGAIYSKKDINIFNSSFMSNRVSSFKTCCGGAVCSEANVYANNSRFIGNNAMDMGGAISAEKGVTLENCLLDSNVAERNYSEKKSFGGAICSNGTVKATNSQFNNNSDEEDGAGICANDVTLISTQNNNANHNGDGRYIEISFTQCDECLSLIEFPKKP